MARRCRGAHLAPRRLTRLQHTVTSVVPPRRPLPPDALGVFDTEADPALRLRGLDARVAEPDTVRAGDAVRTL